MYIYKDECFLGHDIVQSGKPLSLSLKNLPIQHSWLFFYVEDGGRKLLRNIGNDLPLYMCHAPESSALQ